MRELRSSNVYERTSAPSTRTDPDVTSYSLGISDSSVLFPLAVGPITATVSPGSATKDTPERTSLSVPGYLNVTSRNSTRPRASVATGASGSRTDGTWSMTSQMRLLETMNLGRPLMIPEAIMTAEMIWVA